MSGVPQRGAARTSFAGVLRRAMAACEPPLTALEVALLTGTLSEEDVRELADGERRPSLRELEAIAVALEVPMGELLEGQRASAGGCHE